MNNTALSFDIAQATPETLARIEELMEEQDVSVRVREAVEAVNKAVSDAHDSNFNIEMYQLRYSDGRPRLFAHVGKRPKQLPPVVTPEPAPVAIPIPFTAADLVELDYEGLYAIAKSYGVVEEHRSTTGARLCALVIFGSMTRFYGQGHNPQAAVSAALGSLLAAREEVSW